MTGIREVQNSVSEKAPAIPVIDFSGLSDPIKRASICAQVARACETVGFFEVINSEVSTDILDEAFDASRDFFNLPTEDKLSLVQTVKEKPLVPIFQTGYKHFPVLQGVENHVQEMVFRDYHLGNGPEESYTNGSSGDIDPKLNWWPNKPHDYRGKVESLLAQLGIAGDTLLDVFSESLGLPRTYLREVQHKNADVPRYLKFSYYLKGKKSNGEETGLIPHRDSSVFTIVCQGYDTNGLQINPYGEWITVLPRKGSLVVTVGDILQAWSNGRYRSILHRVMCNKEGPRHSIAYFLFPAPGPEADYMIQPIPQILSKENPPAYAPFSYLDFFTNKMQKDSVTHLRTKEIRA